MVLIHAPLTHAAVASAVIIKPGIEERRAQGELRGSGHRGADMRGLCRVWWLKAEIQVQTSSRSKESFSRRGRTRKTLRRTDTLHPPSMIAPPGKHFLSFSVFVTRPALAWPFLARLASGA